MPNVFAGTVAYNIAYSKGKDTDFSSPEVMVRTCDLCDVCVMASQGSFGESKASKRSDDRGRDHDQSPHTQPCPPTQPTKQIQAEVRAAARQANALEFIEKFPEGFNTLIGEGGVALSGGQR